MKLDTVFYEITNNCNLSCQHCYNKSGNPGTRELTDSQAREMIHEIVKIKPAVFCFCGGEPLLRSELLMELSSLLSHNEILPTLVSNGYLLNAQAAQKIRESGFGLVQLSLDGGKGSHNRLRQNEQSFDKVIMALKHLRDHQVNTMIAFSPTSWNLGDLGKVIKIAEHYGVRAIRVQKMMPTGRAAHHPGILPTESQYRAFFKQVHQQNLAFSQNRSPVKIQWVDALQPVYEAKTSPDYKASVLSIKPNGDLSAYPYFPLELGNITRHPITRYLEAGFEDAWRLDIMEEFSKKLTSVAKMNDLSDIKIHYHDLVEGG